MSNTLKIFLSHKHEDAYTALRIKEILKRLADDKKLEVFLSQDDIVAGDNWFDRIRRSLGSSNLLLLLFTDVTKSWDWCLYEAGLFQNLDSGREDFRRVVCLTGTEKIPGPLKHLQAVNANPKSVTRFLKDLYLGKALTGFSEPLSSWLKNFPETLEHSANEITDLISRNLVEHRSLLWQVCVLARHRPLLHGARSYSSGNESADRQGFPQLPV